jgi:diacylglycerol kinase (ATP)
MLCGAFLMYNEHMEEQKIKEKKAFSLVARLKSTTHAWRGLGIFMRTTHNLWLHIFFTLLAVYLGYIMNISNIEWIMIVLAVGLVIIAEAFNTAIEIDIDLTSPNYHPYARDTKDVAAGAVLISVLVAGIIGLIIFLPKIIVLIK